MNTQHQQCSEHCSKHCSEHMPDAMHVRTDERTNGETTHLDGPISPLATRTGAYENRIPTFRTGG